jgi:hypothetical protein
LRLRRRRGGHALPPPEAVELYKIDRQQHQVQEHHRIDVGDQAVGTEQHIAVSATSLSETIVVMQKLARTANDAQKPSPSTQDMILLSIEAGLVRPRRLIH